MNGIIGRWRMRALAGSFAALGAASLTGTGVACADPAPPFAALLRQTAASPRVAILDAGVEQAEGLAEQARARPNPSISVYGENFGGSSPYGGFGRTETTLQYNHPFELGGKRASRIEAGRAGIAAARARGVEGRVAYAYELARAYAGAEIADRRIALAEDEVEEATADLKVARALVAAGKEARLRQLRAETDLNALQSDLEAAKAGRTVAFAQLSALAGIETPYTSLSESLLDRLAARPSTGPIDPLATVSVRAAQADRDAAERRIVVERKRALPDVTAQIGVRRLEIDNATAVVAGISLPLAIFDRNRGNIAAAEAELRGAEARAQIVRLDARAAAGSAQALIDSADRRAVAADRTLATAEETYRLARLAYEAGKSPLIELLAARHGLGVARGVVLDAAAARLDARAGFTRLSGRTITGDLLP
ncbi:cobalt-zinc-cadmium efflux system outer membrane protein [Sphingomonas sp. PP-CE-3G-477]|uniref:TolC family protein n=1 Tax=Sphingomonas sp. PP-CE-3G-477 TaxID=2135660 RepID=UPI000D3CC0B6|nr:TolC family protein [Sphingomonas sp. PP-CE-3G-477]PTQ64950.1 cobalt-zinc-cadmium efflux system outer membrane protein [Sphingomonas sp. PP-CE-3G-477]